MKLFDNKGRLFGIFNIVDILIIAVLIVGSIGAYSVLDKKIQASKATKTYNVTLEMQRVEKYFCDAMIADKTVFDRIQNVPFGTITKIRSKPTVEYNMSSVDGSVVEVEVPERYDVELDMELTTDSELFIGKRLSIGTKEFSGSGYIIKCEEIKDKNSKKAR